MKKGLSIYLSIYLYKSVCLFIYLFIYPSVNSSIYLSIYLCVCLSVFLSVCWSLCLFDYWQKRYFVVRVSFYVWAKISNVYLEIKTSSSSVNDPAQLVGDAEYTDWVCPPPINVCLGYDIKIWWIVSSNSGTFGNTVYLFLAIAPCPLWHWVIAPDSVLSTGQIELFDI